MVDLCNLNDGRATVKAHKTIKEQNRMHTVRLRRTISIDDHCTTLGHNIDITVYTTGVSGISPIPDLKIISSFCPEILHTGSLRVVDIGPVIEIINKHVAPNAVPS
jgi:hypothetical protein